MSQTTIEKRLSSLEKQMTTLNGLVRRSPRKKDWKRSIGAFTDEPAMQSVLDDALRLRAEDRTVALSRAKTKRNSA